MMAATHSLTLLVPVAIKSVHDFGTQDDPKQICWGIAYLQGGPAQRVGHTTNLPLIH